MKSDVTWVQPATLVQAAFDSVKEALEWANKTLYTPDFYTKYIGGMASNTKAKLEFELTLCHDNFKDREKVALTVNIEFGKTLYGVDVDAEISKLEKLVMQIKIDDTLSIAGLNYLQDELIQEIKLYLSGLEDELNFTEGMEDILLPKEVNFDAIGYRG